VAAISREQARGAILDLLAQRDAGKTICPSEAARALGGDDGFRQLMGVVREAAGELAEAGRIEVTQGGKPVDLERAKGPVRLRAVP
jgi:hypothetical protein